MTFGAVPYAVMVFANIAPSWGLFIPAFGAVGVGAAVLWTAQGIYLSRAAIAQASVRLLEWLQFVDARRDFVWEGFS
jgi:hypothetical protein